MTSMTKLERESKATTLKKSGPVKLVRVERRGVVNFQVVVPGQMGTMPIGYPFGTEAEALPFFSRCDRFFNRGNS